MAVTSEAHAGMPLGVGAIVSESFTILFKNFFTVMILAVVPTLIGLLVSGALIGWQLTLGGDPDFVNGFSWASFAFAMIAQIAIYGVATALLVQMAYDAKLGRKMSLGRYISPALRSAVPILILTTIAGILSGLAAIALIIPGLWVYAVFSVVVPAIVIERAGFGGLGRSAELTKNYRWPILGAIILIGICTAILNFVVAFSSEIVSSLIGGSLIVQIVVVAALTGVAYGLSSISVALIYARLREIKEGVSVDDLASVFD